MPTTEFHEPPTREIQNRHRQNPHGIDKRQAVAIAERLVPDYRGSGPVLLSSDLLRARQAQRVVLVCSGISDTGDAPPVFARDCMSREVFTIPPTAELAAALSLLLDRQVHALPVVAEGRLVGMVTLS